MNNKRRIKVIKHDSPLFERSGSYAYGDWEGYWVGESSDGHEISQTVYYPDLSAPQPAPKLRCTCRQDNCHHIAIFVGI